MELGVQTQWLWATALAWIVLRMFPVAPFTLVGVALKTRLEPAFQFLDLLLRFAFVAEPELFYRLKNIV